MQVGRAADPAEIAGIGEGGRDGDRIGRFAPPVEVENRVEDPRVVGPVEVGDLEDLDDVGDGVLRQQHPAEDALLGRHVLRRRPVEATVVGTPLDRPRLGARLDRPRVIGDRHRAPPPSAVEPT
ncbi:MAG: hypothetical protein AUG44_02515 [Actinobacteria bacterium 13_1_20CM_3_71_11]|nr:MAG: hypothetical protein AUG44_02515 [Actinobacteria bacterium 13_1_20CM_3_71_11]